MRAKRSDGTVRENFDPTVWGGDYTEGSAWQNSFFVPHDVEGMAELFGGKEKLLARLDALFEAPPSYRLGEMLYDPDYDGSHPLTRFGYAQEIHEMTEMGNADFGQCAISNQPSFHIPYLYAYLGKPETCAYWVKRMCEEAFSATPDGYPGDEDNGTMSAWYIFSCIGRYPLCPGKKEHVRIPPLVKNVRILGKSVQ